MLPLFVPHEQRLWSPKSPGEIPEHCLGVAPDKQKKEERKEEQSQVFVTVLTALESRCFLYCCRASFSKGFVKVVGGLCYSLSVVRQARNWGSSVGKLELLLGFASAALPTKLEAQLPFLAALRRPSTPSLTLCISSHLFSFNLFPRFPSIGKCRDPGVSFCLSLKTLPYPSDLEISFYLPHVWESATLWLMIVLCLTCCWIF